MISKDIKSVYSQQSLFARMLREPLFHFLAAGFALFVIYDGLHASSRDPHSEQIQITPDDIRRIEISWLARWQRPPSEQQLEGMIDEYVKEEILYREAMKLGLDKNDTIIRRRLAQKMDFLAEDVASLREPTTGILKAWYATNLQHYAPPPLVTFHQLFFSSDKWGADAQAQAQKVLTGLVNENGGEGDPYMFQNTYAEQSRDQVARVFGSKFAIELFQNEPGDWVGPVESGYGWHLVKIETLAQPQAPPFETVAQQVKSDWHSEQRTEAKRSDFAALKARYKVEVIMPSAASRLATTQAQQP